MQRQKPFRQQVIYLFAILCGVMGVVFFLYSMGERALTDDASRSSPAPVSAVPATAPPLVDPLKKIPVTATSEGEHSGPSVRSPATRSLIEVLEKFDRNAAWEISEHPDRRPSHILGGRIKCDEKEIEKCDHQGRALGILRTLAEAMEIDSSSLKQTSISVGSNSYQLDQYYRGYRVFNASIKGFANSGNSELYHIVSELRKIEGAELRRQVSERQARALFAQKFAIEDASKILLVLPEPVVVGESPSSNQLVWWMQYGQRIPVPKSVDAFINATNGQITVRSAN